MRVQIFPGPVGGKAAVPPSKSLAHRAVLCAALAEGESVIHNPAESEDLDATLRAAAALGAECSRKEDRIVVRGKGLKETPGHVYVDCGESGSTLRFLVPLLALGAQPVTLMGHGRLLARPMEPYQKMFAERGLPFENDGTALHFHGPLTAGDYTLSGAVSSQFFTGLLLALPLLKGDSRIFWQGPLASEGYLALTSEVQKQFGVESRTIPGGLFIPGGQIYRPADFCVAADDSQAAFLAVMDAVRGGIELQGLDPDSRQPDGEIYRILRRIRQKDGSLAAFCANIENCPDLGPILMVLALFCKGRSVLRGAGRLRLKESDRLAAMQAELLKFGAKVETGPDWAAVTAGPLTPPPLLQGHGDHRIVMALTAAAVSANIPAEIEGAEAVAKSWPQFFDCLQTLGVRIVCNP